MVGNFEDMGGMEAMRGAEAATPLKTEAP